MSAGEQTGVPAAVCLLFGIFCNRLWRVRRVMDSAPRCAGAVLWSPAVGSVVFGHRSMVTQALAMGMNVGGDELPSTQAASFLKLISASPASLIPAGRQAGRPYTPPPHGHHKSLFCMYIIAGSRRRKGRSEKCEQIAAIFPISGNEVTARCTSTATHRTFFIVVSPSTSEVA